LTSLTVSGTSAINTTSVTTTSGGQMYSGAVSLGASVIFTGDAGTLIHFGSTLGGGATARDVVITNANAEFDGDVGGAGNLVSSLSVDGTTTMGTIIRTSGAQTYTGAVTLDADSSTITGAGALLFSSSVDGAQVLTIQDGSSTGDVTFAGALGATTLTGLVVGAGAFDIAINGGGTVTNAITFQHTGDLTITNGLTVTGGMTSAGPGTNTFAGTVASGGGAAQDIVLDDLNVGTGGLVIDTDLGTLDVSGTVTIPATLTLDLESSQFDIDTLSNNSVLRLTGEQTTHTIANHDVDSGIIEYYGAGGGTVFASGLLSAGYNYYNLRIAGAGTFFLEDDVYIANDLSITGGALDASTDGTDANSRDISVGRNWSSIAGFTDFIPRSGTVEFLGNDVHISGDNEWYIFLCTIDNARIYFENARTQRILPYGVFWIRATSDANRIRLDRENDSGTPSNPPLTPAEDNLFWFFDLRPNATLNMNWVEVFYSNARASPINVPANVRANYLVDPEEPLFDIPRYDYKWLFKLFALYSYTEDTDYNGKLDRLRITTESGINNDFSDFEIEVDGYEIDRTGGTNGYERAGSLNRTLYVYLVEKNYNDTGVRPQWHVARNTSLRDLSTGVRPFGTLETGTSDYMIPGDTAWPSFGYTLNLPQLGQQFIHLSEYVVTAGGATPSGPDLGLSGVPTFVTSYGNGVSEACGPGTVYGTGALLSGINNISITPTLRDMGVAPVWYSEYTGQSPSPPNPSYPPASGYGADPDAYATSGTRPAFEIQRGGSGATAHRVSDVLISVQPSSVVGSWSQANPDSYFVWPIFAIDQVRTTLTDAQIENLTPAQTAAQGIGLIRAFDGTQWLRDQDWRMQARTNAGVGAPSIIYDSNVEAAFVGAASGLWLPEHEETDFSGIDGFPNAPAYGGDPSGPTAGTTAGANLYEWNFSASDPKVFSVAHFDFWFRIAGAPADLYAGRLAIEADATAIPADWFRRVRPFSLDIHDVTLQKGGVSILNNVIDPTRGDTARISYQLASEGAVTITVFTLDGDVVRRLVNQRLTAGDYATSWDGRNLAGDAVARGVYFVRVVAPGIDEIRKVLVVRR
jgi:hypothetical protein